MSRQQRPINDREIKAWLAAGAMHRGVGEGLTFVASTIAAGRQGLVDPSLPIEPALLGEGARAIP